ncbi:hypothetical protein COV93_06740 [Candidatus Woesearchaeota archaeon CG11_big_fil_rev_8_21_14_0_20_43_8]|nr:MAG: hypothetical protein COV93_06740 [Candidatus Woesearchaeota archaeon CG11_big_fil_rev_8_21_14_0_20_43_8]PIO04967.1 MAG: hypothetical protein COT47_06790 [Candidatus Woesearchaeota archaeon CG08_land_8_20_14_0_20_43_7]
MAKLERTYNVPLRKEFLKEKNYKRTEKAVRALKEFMAKHMKSDDVKIGPQLNKKLWDKGIKNPPHHVHVTAVKDDEGVVRVELFGAPAFEAKKPTEKKSGGLKDKLAGAIKGKDAPAKADDAKSDDKPKTDAAEKPKADNKPAPKSDAPKDAAKPASEKKVDAPVKKAEEAKVPEKKEVAPASKDKSAETKQ